MRGVIPFFTPIQTYREIAHSQEAPRLASKRAVIHSDLSAGIATAGGHDNVLGPDHAAMKLAWKEKRISVFGGMHI